MDVGVTVEVARVELFLLEGDVLPLLSLEGH